MNDSQVTVMKTQEEEGEEESSAVNALGVEPRRIKISLVGDGAVGKQCAVKKFLTDEFPPYYIPVVCFNV